MGLDNREDTSTPKEGSVAKDVSKEGSEAKEEAPKDQEEKPTEAKEEVEIEAAQPEAKEPSPSPKEQEPETMDVEPTATEDDKMEIDESAKQEPVVDEPMVEQNGVHKQEEPEKRIILPFKFNISDGGFTELHSIWNSEENVVKSKGMDYEVWNRRHDYWLLCGFAT
jgi:hypothetical protein